MDCEIAILKTLTYSDLFDYPLTFEQLYTFLITEKPYTKEEVKIVSKKSKNIIYEKKLYALVKREAIIEKRIQTEKDNSQKIQKAKKIATILSFIPTVYFIGISGSVAMQNAQRNDDIDLFIITKKNTVWISRVILLLFLHILGVRRRYNDKDVKEKICLNMLIDEKAMSFDTNRQDIYTAHEIAQVVPLVEKDNTYKTFLKQNNWVRSYMPNVFSLEKQYIQKTKNYLLEALISLSFLEYSAKIFQQAIIKKHTTSETVTKNFLAFHPFDYRKKTILAYEKRVKHYV